MDSALARSQRYIVGFIVLLLVDVIWVSSSELTKYIYNHETYEKPFFCTYIKSSMFTLYLVGFLIWPPWRDVYCHRPPNYTYLDSDDDNFEETIDHLSTPMYVPVKMERSSDSDDSTLKSVRFNKVVEVRHLSEIEAADAVLARLSYQAYLRADEATRRITHKLPVCQVVKLAFIFAFLWFAANYTYQLALMKTEAGIVNMLSSSSSLFTLILAAIYPTSGSDRFSYTKLVAVILSIVGIVMVCMSDIKFGAQMPVGSLLSVSSACLYAIYLVFLKRSAQYEDKMDIPMFFGFVGLFIMLLLWPVLMFLHITKIETFEWPTKEQWMLLGLNGLIGTVLSEVLWFWGCYLTSSLMATVSISLTIPMTMLADVVLKNIKFPLEFYLGLLPLTLGFVLVTMASLFENWDPVLRWLRRGCGRTIIIQLTGDEQRESLMGSTNT